MEEINKKILDEILKTYSAIADRLTEIQNTIKTVEQPPKKRRKTEKLIRDFFKHLQNERRSS